jgi:hypothetical protein
MDHSLLVVLEYGLMVETGLPAGDRAPPTTGTIGLIIIYVPPGYKLSDDIILYISSVLIIIMYLYNLIRKWPYWDKDQNDWLY